jgi:hypothetical protein
VRLRALRALCACVYDACTGRQDARGPHSKLERAPRGRVAAAPCFAEAVELAQRRGGAVDARVEAWLDRLDRHSEICQRLVVPAALKWEVRDKLDQATVTDRVLYPGPTD